MRISTHKPSCFDRLKAAFGDQLEEQWENGLIITFAGVVHTKAGGLTPEFAAHEEVHIRQQAKYDPEVFLEKFISDPKFRLEMEMEAYRAQAAFIRRVVRDRNAQAKKIDKMCRDMASNYAGMITYPEALKAMLK